MQRGVPIALVETLKNWYGSLRCSVWWNTVISESFAIQSGVRQGGILFSFLFALYIDDLTDQIRKSGHGLRIGSLLLAELPTLMILQFFQLHVMVYKEIIDICSNYGHEWDIKFNLVKSQLMAFGINNPTRCTITLNKKEIPWVSKVRYLGLYFLYNAGMLGITEALRKFCGSFNNIMSVLGKRRNEMTEVYLAKPYCLSLSRMVVKSGILVMSALHKVNVAWNVCFRRIFCGFYRENVKPLQFLRCSTSFLFCSTAQAFI